MKYLKMKLTICAAAAAVCMAGAPMNVQAASLSDILPAAGLGLFLEEGSSIASLREDVKQKQTEKEKQKQEEAAKRQGELRSSSVAETAKTQTRPLALSNTAVKESLTEITADKSSTDSTEKAVPAFAETGETQQAESASENSLSADVSDNTLQEIEIVEPVDMTVSENDLKLYKEAVEEKKVIDSMIIAQVDDYVNIRKTPSTDGEIVGKLYDNSIGYLIEEQGDWFLMKSGSVEGYVKSEYFKTGEEAKQIADEVGDKQAEVVNAETLYVRKEATTDSSVIGYVPGGEILTVTEELEEWVKISIEEGEGYVSKEYAEVSVIYVTAESVEEERARIAKEEAAKEAARKAAQEAERKLQEEQQKAAETAAAKEAQSETKAQTQAPAAASGSGLGSAVANYACQFVGNPYVYGGTSLTNGADCSGFVMSVYANFGVSLPHSSSADRNVGYGIGSLAEAQPGDIICYSGHVGIYIGNGQIVHASTAATGIKISSATYRNILAIRRIF